MEVERRAQEELEAPEIDPEELAEMQTKELNNGRLAMVAIVGMVVQEGISGGKLF